MARSRFLPRRALGLVAAAALTVLLAQHTTSAAFTAPTSDTGNSVGAAASFCASPGSTTLVVASDAAAYQANPNQNYGSSVSIGIGSASGSNAYSYLKFTLPALPARCDVTSATLRIYATTPMAGATINVYRTASAWTAATMTWNTGRPTFTGTPASTASLAAAGWQQWDVAALTQQLYIGPDYGFMLKDSVDNAGSARFQTWDSLESTTVAQRPRLLLSWG